MNIALVIAGGSGKRMGLEIPKQFVLINDKPVIAYTLEIFEKNPEIDKIGIVCVEGWEAEMKEICEKYNITKFNWLVKGGESCQESIRNGVYTIAESEPEDSIIIIHDGVRPLLDQHVLSDVIDKCKEFGNGVSSMPYNEQIFLIDDDKSTTKYIPRETLRRVVTPQAYRLGKLRDCYERAFKENVGISGSSYTNTMMVELGERLYFADGSDKNIKLTTLDNLAVFKAMLDMKTDENGNFYDTSIRTKEA